MKKKKISTEEKKAQRKIYMAEYYQDNKEERKQKMLEWRKTNPGYISPCRIENPNYSKEQSKRFQEENPSYKKEWHKANPDYIPPCEIENPNYRKEQGKRFQEANPEYNKELNHKHDLGYWVVYLIHNFDGLNNIYCGQTQNIYKRMGNHKSKGTLNTDNYEIIKQLETLEDALEFEAYMHEQGYHGKITGRYK